MLVSGLSVCYIGAGLGTIISCRAGKRGEVLVRLGE